MNPLQLNNRYIIPFLFIFEGVTSWIFEGSIIKKILLYNINYSYSTEDSIIMVAIGLVIIIGDYFLSKNEKIFIKKKVVEFSKCPKCKEVFNYNELEKGKCKYCKDIETIELEEYYKKYPEELEEK